LAGHNGSGKSTLVKILSGYHHPDPGGTAEVNSEPLELGSGRSAEHHGLRFVHQDLALVLELSAVDNIALAGGYERSRLGHIDQKLQVERSNRLIRQLGIELDVLAPLTEASPVEQTAVAIARALWDWEAGPRVLVLDEPTARLPSGEVTRLLDVVRRVRAAGNAVIYVSHRMSEVFRIADTVAVLRDGRLVSHGPISGYTPDRLAQVIAGNDDFKRLGRTSSKSGARSVLRVTNLRGRTLRGVDIDLRSQEILGVAGLAGSGRDEVPYALSGGDLGRCEGVWTVGGKQAATMTTKRARELGVAFVPADRLREGLVAEFTVRENVTLGNLPAIRQRGALLRRNEQAFALRWLERFGIGGDVLDWPIGMLSGGNQQRVLVARWIASDPSVLILSEPTAGVDVAARESLYRLLRESVEAGLSLVVASSDVEDLEKLCDRVLVLRDGTVAAELRGGQVVASNITALLDVSI
jgi:ribose transport system ATP-binding protein